MFAFAVIIARNDRGESQEMSRVLWRRLLLIFFLLGLLLLQSLECALPVLLANWKLKMQEIATRAAPRR